MARVPTFFPPAQRAPSGGLLNAVPVHIYQRETTTEVDVFAAAVGGIPLTQPILSDSEGRYRYWVEPGSYDLFFPDDTVNPTEEWEAVGGTDSATVAVIREAPLNVKYPEFGAVGDGVADDTAAIQDALDACLATGRGEVVLPSGEYRTMATLTVAGGGITLAGFAGELSSIIRADHTAGPAVHVSGRRSGLRNVLIGASAARTAGAAGSNHGLLIDGGETLANRASNGVYENVWIEFHPNSGLVCIGGIWLSQFHRVRVRGNGRHALVIDDGTFVGRTNKEVPGISSFYNCDFFDNGGHGALLGNDNDASNRALRVNFENCDFYRNAEAAGSRKSADQIWAFAEACEFRSCAISGLNQAGTVETTRGAFIYGRANAMRSTRFLNVTPNCVRLGGTLNSFASKGTVIDGFTVVTNVSLDPAVSIDSDVEGARVWPNTTANITAAVNDSAAYLPLDRIKQAAQKLTAQSVTSSTTPINDTTLKMPLRANERAQFRANLFVDGNAAGDFQVGFTAPAGATLRWGPSSGIRVDAADAVVIQPTVTTGTLIFGTAGVGTVRVVELVGEVKTNGTAGDLQLQWAQGTSSATATRVFGQSHLEVTRS